MKQNGGFCSNKPTKSTNEKGSPTVKSTVTGNDEVGYLPASAPDPLLLAALANDMAPLQPSQPGAFAQGGPSPLPTSVGSRAQVLLELAGIKAAIRTWYNKQPDEVLREASAYSARLTEVWTELRLLEQYDRTYSQLRTMQVQPVLDEIDRQYKINQSRIAMMRQDLDLNRGT
jgi:hypothetical protein